MIEPVIRGEHGHESYVVRSRAGDLVYMKSVARITAI
jgi:hypothetical protein